MLNWTSLGKTDRQTIFQAFYKKAHKTCEGQAFHEAAASKHAHLTPRDPETQVENHEQTTKINFAILNKKCLSNNNSHEEDETFFFFIMVGIKNAINWPSFRWIYDTEVCLSLMDEQGNTQTEIFVNCTMPRYDRIAIEPEKKAAFERLAFNPPEAASRHAGRFLTFKLKSILNIIVSMLSYTLLLKTQKGVWKANQNHIHKASRFVSLSLSHTKKCHAIITTALDRLSHSLMLWLVFGPRRYAVKIIVST